MRYSFKMSHKNRSLKTTGLKSLNKNKIARKRIGTLMKIQKWPLKGH